MAFMAIKICDAPLLTYLFRDTEELFLEEDGRYRSYLGSPQLFNYHHWPLLILVDDFYLCTALGTE